MALRTLYDSPVLEPLARAAESIGVEAVLLGSVASRALLFDAAGVPARDLFDLTEHAADIEIAHSGPAERTADFANAIAATMPLAPWFKWSIMDADGLASINGRRGAGFEVPLRQFRLGMRPSKPSRAAGRLLRRALRGEIDLLPPEFDSSFSTVPADQASAVLEYVDAACDVIQTDMRRRPRSISGPGQGAYASALMSKAVSGLERLDGFERTVALQQLWCRFAGSALRLPDNLFQSAAEYFGLDPLVTLLEESGYPALRLLTGDGVPIISACLDDNGFRMPLMMADEGSSVDWPSVFKRALADVDAPSSYSRYDDPIRLASGNRVVGGVKFIPISKGWKDPSSGKNGSPQEFFYLSVRLDEAAGHVDARDLTAVTFGHNHEGSHLLASFASASNPLQWPYGGYHSSGPSQRYTIRVNLLELQPDVDAIDVFLMRGDGF